MQRKKLFNVSGNDDIANRRMVGGNVTNLFNLNNVKYQWAEQAVSPDDGKLLDSGEGFAV